MHGVGRDAHRYIAEWVEFANAEGLTIVVPEFRSADFPGAARYNFGGVFDDAGRPRPRDRWSYSVIEPLFDAVVARERLSARTYGIYGHSAGAQFVHRFVLLGGGVRMQRAVVANAGSYMRPTTKEKWPFGLLGAPVSADHVAQVFRAPLTLLLGGADTDTEDPNLPRQPAALRQGPHRLARGLSFFAEARRAAAQRGAPFAWECAVVPGVGHDNQRMAAAAAPLFGDRIPPGLVRCPIEPSGESALAS